MMICASSIHAIYGFAFLILKFSSRFLFQVDLNLTLKSTMKKQDRRQDVVVSFAAQTVSRSAHWNFQTFSLYQFHPFVFKKVHYSEENNLKHL